MQNLIEQLMRPDINETGFVLPVSTVKRRAATAIAHLVTLQREDLNSRLALQTQVAELEYRSVLDWGVPLEYAIAEYQEVVNNDLLQAIT